MKKITPLLIAILLSACSFLPTSEEPSQEAEENTTTQTSTPDPEPETEPTPEPETEPTPESESDPEPEPKGEIIKFSGPENQCSKVCFECAEHITNEQDLKICGTVTTNVSKIILTSKNQEAGIEEAQTLPSFELGDINWSYQLQKSSNNYAEGKNEYKLQAFQENGELIDEKNFIINYKKLSPTNKDTKIEIKKPENLTINYENLLYGNTLELSGTINNNKIEKIQFISENPEAGLYDDYTFTKFKPGDTTWKTTLKPDFENIAEGKNIYTINAYPSNGTNPITTQFNLNVIYPFKNESIPLPTDMGQETSLEVDWYDQPKELDSVQLLKDIGRYNKFMHEINRILFGEPNSFNYNECFRTEEPIPVSFLEEGIITQGHFSGSKLLTMKYINGWECCCPGAYDQYLRFILRPNGDLILIEKFSDLENFPPFMAQALRYEIQRTIKEMNLYPKTLLSNLPNSGEKIIPLAKDNLLEKRTIGEIPPQPLFTDQSSNQKVYEDSYGCLITKNNDSSHTAYTYILDFMTYENNEYYTGTPDITWNDGTKNTSLYHNAIGECYQMPCYTFQEFTDESILEKIGTTSTGQTVYRIKTEQNQEVNEIIKNNANMLYKPDGNYRVLDPREFNENYGLIFIKNPFDKYIKFIKAEYEVAMGCGKPVIYLYPEKEGDFQVKVTPNLGITYSEPLYNTGWFVHSDTESNIYNYTDQTTYPYLFWEGDVKDYTLPEEGFVFSRENLENELTQKLHHLGLNQKETDDFMEFWYPEMLKNPAPYYFVTFMQQSEFDKVAPLQIKPAPDTTIRIFMVYEPLTQPIKVKPLKITTPSRQGFTVVEWGGRIK